MDTEPSRGYNMENTERSSKELELLIDRLERIGVVGSPSSTSEITLDILASAATKRLVGGLAIFRYLQDGMPHYALGQITEVRLRNVWHEDPTIRSLVRQRGRVDAVSERQDTHVGEMTISAVFAKDSSDAYRPDILGTVPATGTPVCIVDNDILETLLSECSGSIFHLGYVYGSKPLLLPLWFKHFGTGSNGAGEAYHLGIFGKTGSGKSVLAKMILLAYAKYPEMGILVVDPQGEFAKDFQDEPSGEFQLRMRSIVENIMSKPCRVYSITELVLDRWELFTKILYESPFFERLSIPKGDNRRIAAEQLTEELRKKRVRLEDLPKRDSFNEAWSILHKEEIQKIIYRSSESRDRFNTVLKNSEPDTFYESFWKPISQLFNDKRRGAKKIDRVISELFDENSPVRPVIVLNLSVDNEGFIEHSTSTDSLYSEYAEYQQEVSILWNEDIQSLVIKRLLEGIRLVAERAYKNNRNLNSLILMDEAHRLAPREEPENEERKEIRALLIDSARTTRKYGVGWMFISQTLSSLHREIVEQLRIFFFGFGLGMGAEFRALSELVGGRDTALDLYQLFRDPHSSFDTSSREYSFMTIGPVSPLSFSGTPLFLTAFNDPNEFLRANGLVE